MNASQNMPDSDFLGGLVARARAVDGQPPFSDQSLVELERGERVLVDSAWGAAVVSADELELVIDPEHRQQGHGATLAEVALREHPGVVSAWAHGDHPASRALAERFGFAPARTLLQLRAPVASLPEELAEPTHTPLPGEPAPSASPREHTISPFRPGPDDTAWLALNAQSFADHPEQGKLTQRDLDDRCAEPWFTPDDFLVLRDGDTMIGFCWLKVVDADATKEPIGEFYAVGIDPTRQGEGLGRVLMDAGLARLAEQGIRTAALYVEADNEPALALYRRYGFTQHTIDVRYQRTIL